MDADKAKKVRVHSRLAFRVSGLGGEGEAGKGCGCVGLHLKPNSETQNPKCDTRHTQSERRHLIPTPETLSEDAQEREKAEEAMRERQDAQRLMRQQQQEAALAYVARDQVQKP
jgi:hypothetical protein